MFRSLLKRRKVKIAAKLLPIKRGILAGVPMVGVDVGSAEGLQPHWQAFDGVVDFYCFEPHDRSYAKLQRMFESHPHKDMYHLLPIGLSGSGGQRTLHMTNSPTGSSLYPIDEGGEFVDSGDKYFYPISEATIQTQSLEKVLTDQRVAQVDIIKLDIQGAELEVMQGMGTERLDSLLLAELEINICGGVSRNFSPYKGSPTWARIDEVMAAHGMRLLDFGVARAYRSKAGDSDWYQREDLKTYVNSPTVSAHVWETDAVYVRDWQSLIASEDVKGIRKLVVALCAYRFFSEAIHLVESAGNAGVLDETSTNDLKRHVVAWHATIVSSWHSRGKVWTGLRRLMRASGMSQLLRWKQYMWFEYPHG